MDKTPRDKSVTAYFFRISPEILYSIFAYFCPHCCNEYQWPFGAPPPSKRSQDNTTLYNLCLVARYFRPFAQEILHHSFDPHYASYCATSHGAPNPWERRLEPFLQTVASRPDLARSVKTVFLKLDLVSALDFNRSRKAFDVCAHAFGSNAKEIYRIGHATHSSLIKRAFFRGAPPPRYMRPQDFIPTVMGQLLSILVSLLPSLAHLCIEEDCRWRFDVSTTTLDVLRIDSIPLKTLESDYALETLIFRAPELETLVTSVSSVFPKMPCVRNLHIRAKLGTEISAISQCLSACTGTLSAFSYTAFDFDIVGVVNLLGKSRFRASLESLHLDMRYGAPLGDYQMPSLREFTKVRSVFLHTYFLYGTEHSCNCEEPCVTKSLLNVLPPNILSLQLSEEIKTPHGPVRDDLLRLALNAPVDFPLLRDIKNDADYVCDEYLETSFKSIGIDLTHQNLPMRCWLNTDCRITGTVDWNDICTGGAGVLLPGELSDEDL